MTPPDTNLKTQRRRHRPALYAIAFAVLFGMLTLLIRVFVATDPDEATLGADPLLRAPLDEQVDTAPPENPPRLPARP